MLLDLGARTILLGHSERRHELGEPDELINRKVRAVLGHGATPVLCVGETEEERRQGLTFTTIEGQLRAGLTGVAAVRGSSAHEPV
jgi:triosephosphate isomerase